DHAFGSAVGNTVVQTGATLQLQGSRNIAEPLSLVGTLETLDGANTWTGAISLPQDGIIQVDGSSMLSLTGDLDGAGGFKKTGSGDLNLHPHDSTYAGETVIDQGKLIVDVANALGTAAAGTSVQKGASLEFQG